MAGEAVDRARLPDGRVDLKSLGRADLAGFMGPLGNAQWRSLAVFKWTWKFGARGFHEMDNIPKPVRATLTEQAALTFLEPAGRHDSEDGTKKYLWRTHDGHTIESVLIPDEREGERPRLTLCVSTQVGCAMKCSFCLTGDLGLARNLSPAEIANQPLQVQADLGPERRITNLVMMGMGEPLHNYEHLKTALDTLLDVDGQNFSHRRITVSTVGLVPQLQRLAQESMVNIAVSLNATTEAQRRAVMPITRRHSLAQLMAACRALPLPAGKRIAFEYVMMDGFNCSEDDLERLVALMEGIPAKVNLIPYNENPRRLIRRPDDALVKRWQDHLINHGVNCSIRTTRGRDISAACGQLGEGAKVC